MRPQSWFLALSALTVAGACTDVPPTTEPTAERTGLVAALEGDNAERYVAIGTSISMGWASNGVYEVTQRTSWPARLGFRTHDPITLPLIESPGCQSPLVAPLANGVRLSGEPISGSVVCAPNVAGVTLPTQNVGTAGALAVDVLQRTPGGTSPPWYARVLPAGMTQLTAALSQQPTILSIELGGNEVLGVTTGLFAPGVTILPFPYFAQPMNAILNAIGPTNAKVLLFEMPTDASNIPALRPAREIWNDRRDFAELYVDVSSNCEGSPNYINVSVKSLNVVFEGAYRHAHGLPNAVYSCADIPGTTDLVVTPADIDAANALIAQMREFIEQQAAARGYALASLGALYDRPDLQSQPYSVVRHLTSSKAFGVFFSLDGVHPSAFGQAVLAREAERAFNDTYGAQFAQANADLNVLAADETSVTLPSVALQMAKTVASQNRDLRLSPCIMPGECQVTVPRR